MRVLLVAGQGRSGSTLLERALGELPGACSLGEATNIWGDGRYQAGRCGCGSVFAACPFWSAVGERAFGGWQNVDRRRVHELWTDVAPTWRLPRLLSPGRDRRSAITEFANHHARVYTAAASVTGAQVVVDSSKAPTLAYCLRLIGTVDLRVIHLVRDPRGVAYSWTKQVAAPYTDGGLMMPRFRPAISALRWNAFNMAVHLLGQLRDRHSPPLPGRVPVRRVRYEDFVADPRATVESLAAFAGLAPATADLAYIADSHVDLGTIHSAGGNPIRFTLGRLPLHRDDEWRTRLPARQRRIVSALCAPGLAAYGYPLVPR